MARSLLLLLSCVVAAASFAGCASETADESVASSSAPAPAAAGDSKAGTASQLSINPDYKK